MIGLGAKYLTAAGFGRYRITAASLGSNLMFRMPWSLSGAAWQAIMAAFGVDGTAVIRATNEYLNGIAASDKAKATALAGFINTYEAEDPHMIYSIVPTLGVRRWLGTTDGAYINSGFIANNYAHSYQYDTIWKASQIGNNTSMVGAVSNGAAFGQMYLAGSECQVWGAYNWANTGLTFTVAANTDYVDSIKFDFDNNKGYRTLNGSSLEKNVDMRTRVTIPMFMYAYNNGGNPTQNAKCSFAEVKLYGDDVLVKWFVPFIRNNVNGMLDLIGGTFYANAGSGSFTISETPTP